MQKYQDIPCGIINNSQTDFKRKRNKMLEFIRNTFRNFILIGFWIILIGFPIAGGIIGNALSGWRSNYTVVGVILGLVIGFVVDIFVCGFIAVILNIDENLEYLRFNSDNKGTSSGSTSSGGNLTGADLSNISSIKPNNPVKTNSSDSWVCKKCSERNPNTASLCKGCGEYK